MVNSSKFFHVKSCRKDCVQYFDNFLVIDFEATCETNSGPDYYHEIIEFPCILVDGKTKEIISTFHSFVKPKKNPNITAFCTKLTGISQNVIDKAPPLDKVWNMFLDWLQEHNVDYNKTSKEFVIITDGDTDIGRFLIPNLHDLNCYIPESFYYYVDLRCSLLKILPKISYLQIHKMSLKAILTRFSLSFEGKEHSGMDDAKNILALLKICIKNNVDILPNSFVEIKKEYDKETMEEYKYYQCALLKKEICFTIFGLTR
uniref:Exonuclease domain-containing protein n=1 Tax=Strongyloides stercoralis TaxID=6248 RepID=A0A0K0DVL5_STRER